MLVVTCKKTQPGGTSLSLSPLSFDFPERGEGEAREWGMVARARKLYAN